MDSKFNAIISASGHSRRLSNVGMSASPLTPDIGLRRSEPTLRAIGDIAPVLLKDERGDRLRPPKRKAPAWNWGLGLPGWNATIKLTLHATPISNGFQN